MKVGKRKRCRSCFTTASRKCSYFYTTFGTNLNLFTKQNPHLEQNEHGPGEAMFDALVIARK